MEEIISSRHPSPDSLPDQRLHLPGYAGHTTRSRSRSPSPSRRGRSPTPIRRSPVGLHHDMRLIDTVSNVVEIVKHDPGHGHGNSKKRITGSSWSASTSPARSPSPSQPYYHPSTTSKRYGTTSLEQRSRSPSPLGTGPGQCAQPRLQTHHYRRHPPQPLMSHPIQQQSYPVLVSRRGQGRRLPDTPSKPSTLQLRPASINFPKLNASPTHCPTGPIGPMPLGLSSQQCPLSFEQAVAMGRGGRLLPSPVPNGYKPGQQRRNRHSDSDDDDWC